MGYTHYFQQKKNITKTNWIRISQDVKKAIEIIQGMGIFLESNAETDDMVTSEYINFNGKGNDSYETFHITKKKEPFETFNFCKTGKYPYDIAVVVTLLIINYHQPNAFDISSDGKIMNWNEGMLFNAKHFGYAYKPPVEIFNKEQEITDTIIKEIEQNLD